MPRQRPNVKEARVRAYKSTRQVLGNCFPLLGVLIDRGHTVIRPQLLPPCVADRASLPKDMELGQSESIAHIQVLKGNRNWRELEGRWLFCPSGGLSMHPTSTPPYSVLL